MRPGFVAAPAVLVHEVRHHMGDLIPQLQKRASMQETAAQIAWLAIGIGLVMAVSWLVHAH